MGAFSLIVLFFIKKRKKFSWPTNEICY